MGVNRRASGGSRGRGARGSHRSLLPPSIGVVMTLLEPWPASASPPENARAAPVPGPAKMAVSRAPEVAGRRLRVRILRIDAELFRSHEQRPSDLPPS